MKRSRTARAKMPCRTTWYFRWQSTDAAAVLRARGPVSGTALRFILLVQDLDVRIVNAITGELFRELIIDPTKDYQPTGAPKGPTRK